MCAPVGSKGGISQRDFTKGFHELAINARGLNLMELYEANAALGAITGQISSEDVLEDIFSRFCVGK